MAKKVLIALLGFALIAAVSCQTKLKKTVLTIEGSDGAFHRVKVEIADTEGARTKGLMARKSLGKDEGMLFIFESDQILSFWMKNTFLPLSIAFIRRDGTICNIADMTPLSLDTTESTQFCRYALEVNQGWFEKNKIKAGDKVNLPAGK